MKKYFGTSVFLKYFISYLSAIMISSALLGIILVNISIHELNKAAVDETEKKIRLIAADLENQQDIMGDIVLKIATTIYYKPYYRERGKYYEIDILEDFSKFEGRSVIVDDYFMFFEDDDWIFKNNKTKKFKVYARNMLNMSDPDKIEKLYEKLNNLEEFKIILPENNESQWIMFAYHVPITTADETGANATLCFVTLKDNLIQRFNDVSGDNYSDFKISFKDKVFFSTIDNMNENKDNIISMKSPNQEFKFEYHYSGRLYKKLNTFVLINIIMLIAFIFVILAVAIVAARKNSKPISELARRYGKLNEETLEKKDELGYLDSLLNKVIEKQRISQNRINQQYIQLKKQQVLLMLNGESDIQNSPTNINKETLISGEYFAVIAIKTQENPKNSPALLCKLIEDLSKDEISFNAIDLKQKNCYAILVGLKKESNINEASELVFELMETTLAKYSMGIGGVYNDTTLLPTSLLTAISNCTTYEKSKEEDFHNKVDSNPDIFCEEELKLVTAIRSCSKGDIKISLEKLKENIKEKDHSLIIERCILIDIVNKILKMTYEMKIQLKQEQIGILLVEESFEKFFDDLEILIEDICLEIMKKKEHLNDEILEKILVYIKNHALEYDLSQQKIADYFDISKNYLYRIIRDGTGKSYKDYLTELRMEKARIMLTEEDLTVAQTCQEIGYVNISHFIKTFKNITGHTPGRYKKIYKKK